jgi:hypothetical protein
VHIHYRVLNTICSIALSSYSQGQMCTWTKNSRTLAPTYSSSSSHSVSSNTKLQGRSLPKSGVSTGMPGRDSAKTTFIRRPVSQRLSLMQIFCTQLSEVETLTTLNFQPFDNFRFELQRKLQKVWRLSQNYPVHTQIHIYIHTYHRSISVSQRQ